MSVCCSNNHPVEYAFLLYDNFVVTQCVLVRSRRRQVPVSYRYTFIGSEAFTNIIYQKLTILKHCDVTVYNGVLFSYMCLRTYINIYEIHVYHQHYTHAYHE